MRLFYDPNISHSSTEHVLSEDESKHIIRVLRLKSGDQIGLLNGKGLLAECTIIDPNPKRCVVRVDEINREEQPDHSIHIAVSPTKQNERMEWLVEKATEIGLTHLSLIETGNSERTRIKPERLERKAVSAMKQSNRKYLPKIDPLIDVKSFIQNHPNGLIAHCYNEEERNEFEEVFSTTNCPILIGPEGDFSKEEVELAIKNGYKSISLGTNRLRTETAALYAVMRAKLATDK